MRKVVLLVVWGMLIETTSTQQGDYKTLIRLCSQHEREAIKHPQKFQFLERTQFDWGSETRAVIETDEGSVERIIAYNDQPLAVDQQQKQQKRLARLMSSREALQQAFSSQNEEAHRRELMITTLPEAFILTFSGAESDGRIRFEFTPNPKFSPESRETQVFKGMRGSIWVDPQHERILEARGELFKDVNFGWGILGRLHKGGHFKVVQSEVSPGIWRITTLNLDFRGRIFLFTSLRVLREETSTEFVPTPPEMNARTGLSKLFSQYASGAQSDDTAHDTGRTEQP